MKISDYVGKNIGKYHLIGKLGKGFGGNVWEVAHVDTGERFAMKAALPMGQNWMTAFKMIRYERETLQDIGSHNNIVHLVEGGAVDLPMEEGGIVACYFNILGIVNRWIPQRVDENWQAAKIIAGIARGCSAAHEKEWVYRDIKPSNMLIDSDFHARLSDFGLSYKLGDKSRKYHSRESDRSPNENETRMIRRGDDTGVEEGTIIGSACYMSPEQTMSQYVSFPADVYSLGASLYELITGVPPHDDEGVNPYSVMIKTCTQDPLPIRKHRWFVPKPLKKITMAMLEKKPENRPTMPEAASVLELIAA